MNAVTDSRTDQHGASRNSWGIAVVTRVILVMILTLAGALSWAAAPGTQPPPIRGEIVLARASHPWMSQQIEEPCILPNPKAPGRLIMFYSAVASSNRVVAAVGKAWADTRSPFRWHQDEANPVFGPTGRGWDSTTNGPIKTLFRTVELPRNLGAAAAAPTEATRPLNLSLGRVGDVAFVGFGGEVFNKIGQAIKTASPFRSTFILTHCNGAAGYVPTRASYAEGGYEVQSSPFAPGAGEQLIETALQGLRDLQ